jgi:hypothetical protein
MPEQQVQILCRFFCFPYQRDVAQMAFAGYFVKNAANWPTTHPDIIGLLSDDISQSQRNRFGQQPVKY